MINDMLSIENYIGRFVSVSRTIKVPRPKRVKSKHHAEKRLKLWKIEKMARKKNYSVAKGT